MLGDIICISYSTSPRVKKSDVCMYDEVIADVGAIFVVVDVSFEFFYDFKKLNISLANSSSVLHVKNNKGNVRIRISGPCLDML